MFPAVGKLDLFLFYLLLLILVILLKLEYSVETVRPYSYST